MRPSEHEVHVWHALLGGDGARAVTREILARYAGLKPRELELRYGSHGKPRLANAEARARGLDFSVSCSGEVTVVAVGIDGALGVDVERLARPLLTRGLIERCFTAAETVALCELPARERHVAALRLWTAKEAYVKALGPRHVAAVATYVARPRLTVRDWALDLSP